MTQFRLSESCVESGEALECEVVVVLELLHGVGDDVWLLLHCVGVVVVDGLRCIWGAIEDVPEPVDDAAID
jgi:hypothetical protein